MDFRNNDELSEKELEEVVAGIPYDEARDKILKSMMNEYPQNNDDYLSEQDLENGISYEDNSSYRRRR